MPLIAFRSRAAAEAFYFSDDAQRLLELAGKSPAPRGIFTTDQLADAISRLEQAIADERATRQAKPADGADADETDGSTKRKVALAQRAFPLLDMLRAAQRKNVDVTWGV